MKRFHSIPLRHKNSGYLPERVRHSFHLLIMMLFLIACHSLDGSELYGPTLRGIYLKNVTVIRNGRKRTIRINRKYLKRAIRYPEYEKVWGYQDKTMPEPDISGEDLDHLVDFLMEMNAIRPEGD